MGRLGVPLVCGGCLFAPSASELERAGTRVTSQAIDKSAQAAQNQLAALRAEERLRQATDGYEAAMKSASESHVRADLPGENGALNRQRMALAADLRREREALVATVQQERNAILGAIREERAVVLIQADAISQRLADHFMTRLTTLAETAAPRLVDQAARSIRDVARTALWGGGALVVILGLPFAAGLVFGRFLGARRQA